MVDRFIISLSENWQIAIFVAGLGAIGWLIKRLIDWIKNKRDSSIPPNISEQTPSLNPPPVIAGVIHNLPYGSIGNLLKGRTTSLHTLQKTLAAAKPTAITQPAAIHGLGGVGKTRLAVEYAIHSLNNKTYTAGLFVSADSIFSLNTNLAALAAPDLLNLPEFNQPDQSVIVKAVISAVSHRNDCLLILDNVDNKDSRQYICDELLPQLTEPHVLITSRLSNWPPDLADLSVTALKTKEAASYLRSRTDRKLSQTKNDHASSEQLAKALDGLPVALEQAAAYINRTHITFDKYLEQFNASRVKTLARYETLVNYDSPVLFTWTSTQAHLDPIAHGILRMASLLGPEPIPTALFESQPDSLTEVIDLFKQEEFYQEVQPPDSDANLGESLADLADWSMITLTQGSFTVHRIVQDAVRLTIPSDMRKPWTELALKLVNDYIPDDPPSDDVRSWALWAVIDPHVACIIEQATSFDIPEPTTLLMNGLALYLTQRVRFDEAEHLHRRALASNEKLLGPDHPNVATCLNNLATLYHATNRLAEAEPLMQRALKIGEASFGKDHPNVAIRLNNLAQLYRATNRLKQAEPLAKRALAIDEASLGSEHPNVARDLNNLALLYQDSNRLKQAEPLIQRALAIDEASLGSDHPNVAIGLNNLAQLYKDTNRLKEAEPLMERALAIDEASFGKDHPEVATALNNLAQLYQDTNRLKEAEPLMKRALAIDEASLGSEHPNVALRLNNLAALYKNTNRLKEAAPLMQRALAIDEASLGSEHPTVARDLNNLAQLYQATNRLKEAEPLMERHLVIFLQFTRRTGHPHPHLPDAIENYKALLTQMGHSEDEVNNRLKRLAPEMFE